MCYGRVKLPIEICIIYLFVKTLAIMKTCAHGHIFYGDISFMFLVGTPLFAFIRCVDNKL